MIGVNLNNMETNNKGHKIIRSERQFNLCRDTSAGYPTYYIENTILVKYTQGKGISSNFEEDKKKELLSADSKRFTILAKRMVGNDLYSKEIAINLWKEFKDIPLNNEDELDGHFYTHTGLMFERGTNKLEVWQWFEDAFFVSVTKDLIEAKQ
jgi:hypothetical protein